MAGKNHPDAVIVSIESDHDAVIKQLYNMEENADYLGKI